MSPPSTAAAAAQIQHADLGGARLVVLYDVDLSPVWSTAPTLHIADSSYLVSWWTDAVARGGTYYVPAPLEAEGFDAGGNGAPPQPTLRIANASRLIDAWVHAYDDLLGAIVTRTVTLDVFLDGGAEADSTAYLRRDVYKLEQKTSHTAEAIEWRLVSALDRGDKKLPAEQVLDADCTLRYRVWSGSAWVYTSATCPYTGSSMWTVEDVSTTTESEDRCSRLLSGCRLRFPSDPLPITAFPGAGSGA